MRQYEIDKQRLQKYLPQLRGCAGLSAEALADKIGLTKQAISYIEKNDPEKPMTKMQYICIRAVFDEEYAKNPDNINLRDCYDLVFSDPEFYKKNIDRIEYAMYQAVEDTKTQKKRSKAEAKKTLNEERTTGDAVASLQKAARQNVMLAAGATAATKSIGGIAAATFPMMFAAVSLAAAGAIKAKQKKEQEKVKRASHNVRHPDWMNEAFDAMSEEN